MKARKAQVTTDTQMNIRLPGADSYHEVIHQGMTYHLPIDEKGKADKQVVCGWVALGQKQDVHSARRRDEALRAFKQGGSRG